MTNTTKKTVLVVEDDQDVRLGHELLLGREFETRSCEDSIQALTIARRERPDVLVLDLGLPGCDGLEVLNRLREIPELSNTPTIVVTGRDGDAVLKQAHENGAVAVFRKPADPVALVEAIRRAVATPVAAKRRVLVVEDDEDIRTSLTLILRSADYDVSTAPDGATALLKIKQTQPELVLLDLGLPCGGGLGVLQRMRALDESASTPVVVLSGRDLETVSQDPQYAAADAWLQKPAGGGELLACVGALLAPEPDAEPVAPATPQV
ncbi:MAG: response regulator [Planctomycetes bacterium]|nr:response regulator [Planctomycetota bacterium]